jgi:SAM-dependent methyltransferase
VTEEGAPRLLWMSECFRPMKSTITNVWPFGRSLSAAERIALKVGRLPGYCCICGRFTLFRVDHPNFREHVACGACDSRNRQRQIAAVLLSYTAVADGKRRRLQSINDLPKQTVIWNAETTRALHQRLALHLGDNYIASEYLGPELRSGEARDGVLHVDMQKTHFADNSLDFVLSSDVMEHVPLPLVALRETFRILKPGGCHIFTAQFYHHRFTNEKRTVVDGDGDATYLRRPWYHDDPVRPEGALVYTVFAPQLLCQLEEIGFEARLCALYSPFYGMLGDNGLVIVARKVLAPGHERDWIFPDETWMISKSPTPAAASS